MFLGPVQSKVAENDMHGPTIVRMNSLEDTMKNKPITEQILHIFGAAKCFTVRKSLCKNVPLRVHIISCIWYCFFGANS